VTVFVFSECFMFELFVNVFVTIIFFHVIVILFISLLVVISTLSSISQF
jgi:hypothetical protein